MKAVLRHPVAPPVVVEIADTAMTRNKGLRQRYYLPWYAGMLFVFPESEIHRFTMEDTPLSLDMVFMDQEGLVVGCISCAQPYSKGPYSAGIRARYVLEVNAGWVRSYGVEPGDVFTYTAN